MITDTLRELLNKRGIITQEEIEEFLSKTPKLTYDQTLLPDLEAGVDLIFEEIKKGTSICIYGDYDADGITSTTLMLSILKNLLPEDRLGYYIPSRFDEGYGLNIEAIEHIAKEGYGMIITVDCGSVSCKEVEHGKELGLKILVTDHHNITDTMANCLVINPKRPDSKYPFKELSGCGVSFKVAQQIQKKAGLPKSVLTDVLDLVAIGTIGDIMPLVDENRTMVKYGMKVINSGRRYGLKKLILGAGLNLGKVKSENVGFVIVPHLNASGRIEDASLAVELLKARETDEVDHIVNDLLQKNKERKRLQQETFKKCIELAQEDGISEDNIPSFVAIKSEDAHEGIAGIVAGKIKDKYYRPTIIVTPTGEENEYLKGTGRSIEGIDLYKLLSSASDLFERFGGHKGACGFLMKKENYPILKERLFREADLLLEQDGELFIRKHPVDLVITPKEADLKLAEEIELLAPFGNKNPRPQFKIGNVSPRYVRYMGNENQHVRFSIYSSLGAELSCVYFNCGMEYGKKIINASKINIIGSLEAQEWQGVMRIQFMIAHIEFE